SLMRFPLRSLPVLALAVGLPLSPAHAQVQTSSQITFGTSSIPRFSTLQFGDATRRALAYTNNFEVGWMDLDQAMPVFSSMTPGNSGFSSFRWERSNSPLVAYLTTNGTPGTGGTPPQLWRVTIGGLLSLVGGLGTTSGSWSIDAIAPGNGFVYLRNATNGQIFRMPTNGGPAVRYVSAATAVGNLDLSPNGQTLAYPFGDKVALQPTSTTSGSGSLLMMPQVMGPTGPTTPVVRDVRWIDDQFLVALLAPSATSGGQLARIDRNSTQVDFLTQPVGGLLQPNYKELSISGDRQWITCLINQSIQDTGSSAVTQEQSAVAMRIHDGVTTSPGGGYIVLDACSSWSVLQAPRIQQTGSAFEPRCVFEGRAAGTSGLTHMFSASLQGDVAITNRATTNPTTTTPLTFGTRSGPNDTALIVAASLDRTHVPVPVPLTDFFNDLLIVNPQIFFGSVIAASSDVVFTIPLQTSPAPLGIRFFWQTCWLSPGPNGTVFTLGRVTEQPIF
ncbi:MAG: hypothetical protein AB7F67_27330, partial [Rhodospirillaceae bacterium]